MFRTTLIDLRRTSTTLAICFIADSVTRAASETERNGRVGSSPSLNTKFRSAKSDQRDEALVVGKAGFEPAASWSQTRRANQAALLPEVSTLHSDASVP